MTPTRREFLQAMIYATPALAVSRLPNFSRKESIAQQECLAFTPEERKIALNDFLEGYQDYKTSFITSDGAGLNNEYLRVVMPEEWNDPQNRTTSEAIGYGMVFAVHADEQETFDKLWQYAQSHFVPEYGLMHWNIDPQGNWIDSEGNTFDGGNYQSPGPASDADIDMASALMQASQKWQDSSYAEAAKTLINNIMTHEVDQQTYTIKLSPIWGGGDLTSPDRFDPVTFRAFGKFTQNDRWDKVSDNSIRIIQKFLDRYPAAVMLPSWINVEGEALDSNGEVAGEDAIHDYDATRYQLRLAKLLVDGECPPSTITELFRRENIFYEKLDPTSIKDGYTISGQPVGEWDGGNTFVSNIYAVSAVSADSAYRQKVWQALQEVDAWDDTYFGESVRLYSLLVVSQI